MITYGYFNSVNGDRKYNADQMSEYFQGLIANGVYEGVGDALVVMEGSGMQVAVGSGRAMIDCKWLKNSASYYVDVNAANGLNPRYTAVVVHLDRTNRLMEITTIDGTPAADPQEPTIDRSEYLCLAMILVPAGATSISQIDIQDRRSDTRVCGWVTGLIEQISTTNLWLQWEAGFEEWFRTLTDQLNVNTYIRSYRKTATLSSGAATSIPLDMTGYVYDASDVILVFINGLLADPVSDYTMDATTHAITPTATSVGTTVQILAMKSVIGFFVLATSDGNAIASSDGDAISI